MKCRILAFLLAALLIVSVSSCGNRVGKSIENTITVNLKPDYNEETIKITPLSKEGKNKFMNRNMLDTEVYTDPMYNIDDLLAYTDEVIVAETIKLDRVFEHKTQQVFTLKVKKSVYGQLKMNDEIIFLGEQNWFNVGDDYLFFLEEQELDFLPQKSYVMADVYPIFPFDENKKILQDEYNKKYLTDIKSVEDLEDHLMQTPKSENPVKRDVVAFIESGNVKEMVDFSTFIDDIEIVSIEISNEYYSKVYYRSNGLLKGESENVTEVMSTNVLNTVKLETGKKYLFFLKKWPDAGVKKVSRHHSFIPKGSKEYAKALELLKD